MSEDVIRLSASADNVYRAMADAFVTYSNEVIQKTGACVVGITGGSVVEGLMAVLVDPLYNQKVNWEDTYFLWTDERFVDYDDPDSYYGRIARLVDGAVSDVVHLYGVPMSGGSLMNAAAEYEQELKNVLRGLDKTALDLVILDLGQDGHIAGLFPKSSVLTDTDHWAVPVKDGKVWDRVSMTFSFLAKATTVWFGVVGERKRAALRKVFYQRKDFEGFSWDERLQEVLPGAVLCQDDMVWFVDQEAYEGAALRQG